MVEPMVRSIFGNGAVAAAFGAAEFVGAEFVGAESVAGVG